MISINQVYFFLLLVKIHLLKQLNYLVCASEINTLNNFFK